MGSNSGDPMPRLNDLDTVPPPDGGDAYGNATVVRQAPSEILEAVRREVAAEKEAAQSERRPTGATEPKVVVDEPETVVVDLPDERPPAAPAAAARAPTPAAPARAAAPAAPATLDAAALRPARLPQDIEKLVPGASAPKPVEAAPAPDAAADEMPLEVPSSRRKRLIVSIVVAVIVAWLAAMAAVGVSHFAGT